MTKALKHLRKDPLFKTALKGLKPLDLESSGNVFNELTKAIAYQQISIKAAATIYGRFERMVGDYDYMPDDVLQHSVEEIRAVGFSSRKAQYVHNIAIFWKERKLYNKDWSQLSDEAIVNLLTEIKGVGSWTVEMILIFQLHRTDVFPIKDLGIQQAMMGIYGITLEKKALMTELTRIAETWAPHRTLASLYLWSWNRAYLKK